MALVQTDKLFKDIFFHLASAFCERVENISVSENLEHLLKKECVSEKERF